MNIRQGRIHPMATLAVCAGFGSMFGLLWFQGQPLGMLVGAIVGWFIGLFIVAYQRSQRAE